MLITYTIDKIMYEIDFSSEVQRLVRLMEN